MIPTITVDIGTTGVKLACFDAAGAVVSSTTVPTPTRRDAWGEIYDLDALDAAITAFVSDLDVRNEVRRIAITGTGESGGLVRGDLTLASPMILWHDHRGEALLATLTDADRERLYAITGLPANPNYGLSKVAWALQHAGPDDRDAQWLNVAEYLAATWTGRRWAEYSLASRTMALDLERGTWSDEACALLDVPTSAFPALRPAADGVAVSARTSRRWGLHRETRVHVAGHDHMVGGVGADLHRGELLNSTGTTEGLLFLRDAPRLDARAASTKIANGISCDGSSFTLFASIPTGGSAFGTLHRLLGWDAADLSSRIGHLYERYIAGRVDLDAAPVVLPYFRGSPPPAKDASARGVIAGVGDATTADDLIVGCFLGMVRQFADVLGVFDEPVDRVKVIGPAARNPLWLQLKADLLGVPLTVARFPQVVSRGAQAIASHLPGDWAAADTYEVDVDATRHARLQEWLAADAIRWGAMKEIGA